MPDPRTVCTVKANGRLYTAWKSITITNEYADQIPHFQMTCSEGGPLGGANDGRRLVPQTPVQIYLGGKLVLTGAISVRLTPYDGNSHDVIVGGRSATSIAVRSSMPVQPGNFDGYTAEQAARGALAPHGVDLKVVNPPALWSKPFPFLAVNPGERVGEFIERMAKMRGAYTWGDAQGNLCIGQGDSKAKLVADLQEGRNILRASVKLDDQDIFASTIFHGQQPGIGDDMANRTAQAAAADPSAKTTAIRVEHAEHPGDSDDMAARTNLEVAHSRWVSVEATVTVAGWFRPDGELWAVTDNVGFYSPMGLPTGTGRMPADDPLGVQSVTYAQDSENGTTTTLVLVRAAYLGSTPRVSVPTDGAGGYTPGGNPSPAQPVPPDYSQGSAGPGGLLGHV